MTREEKIKKRKLRAHLRGQKRFARYVDRIQQVRELGSNIPLSTCGRYGVMGSWPDPNSPTGYSQKCSYDAYGICQSPCNGDC